MSRTLTQLNSEVTDAILAAERLERSGVTVESRRAWQEVSRIEEAIAGELAAKTLQGAIARCGAVSAAFSAEDWARVSALAARYLADPSLHAADRADIEAMAESARAQGP